MNLLFEITVLDIYFFIRLSIVLATLFILVKFSFSRSNFHTETTFVYFTFGVGIFVVTYVMKESDVSLGFAFGLFAIFSMLRYRTDALSFKQMTNLFLIIVVALLCGISPLSPLELTLISILIIAIVLTLENPLIIRRLEEKEVRYEKIENIKPQNRLKLIEDLCDRTGLDIFGVEIISINFMQDTALLRIRYSGNKV